MPLTIVDSSILIDVSRGNDSAITFLDNASESGVLWSVTPVRSELWAGARPNEETIIAAILGRLRWQDVTVSIADRAGRYANQYRRSHRIGFIDLAIAATAAELDGVVATLNVRHFPMFPGLQPPY